MLRQSPAHLVHDPARVIARFFLPGQGLASAHSRVAEIVDRVLMSSDDELDVEADRVLAELSTRHADAEALLLANARAVGSRIVDAVSVTRAKALVLGAAFTAEYAVEGAALCNPSAVPHPSQAGLQPGELRVAVSLRCIGEGHTSSIGFAEAVIGADDTWTFAPRSVHATAPTIRHGEWIRDHFRRSLEDEGHLTDLTSALVNDLPDRFTVDELDRALLAMPEALATRPDARKPQQVLRDLATSAYSAEFDRGAELSSRTMMPVVGEERNGVEDARFVLFTGADGATEYRATFTAYDGRHISSRLLTSPDLVSFDIHRLTGRGAHDKGMALFPRLIEGDHYALSRIDGESISLARSNDGLSWRDVGIVHAPSQTWELIQLGNCGSPIETDRGWLVLTHGVGALRTYSLGALLLDLDDPSRVLAQTLHPLLQPHGEMQNGYVPRVVYSCGAIAHRGTLWIPIGVGDSRIHVYSVGVDELLDSMSPTSAPLG